MPLSPYGIEHRATGFISLKLMVTGSVTQVSLFLPSFPAQSSVGFALAEHSNVTTEASLAAAGLRTFRGRKHIVTATGKHLSSSSSQMGCVSQISSGFNLFPFGSYYTADAIDLLSKASLAGEIVSALHQLLL